MVILLYTSTQNAERHQFAVTLEGSVILIDCMIFLSPFLDVKRVSMSTVS